MVLLNNVLYEINEIFGLGINTDILEDTRRIMLSSLEQEIGGLTDEILRKTYGHFLSKDLKKGLERLKDYTGRRRVAGQRIHYASSKSVDYEEIRELSVMIDGLLGSSVLGDLYPRFVGSELSYRLTSAILSDLGFDASVKVLQVEGRERTYVAVGDYYYTFEFRKSGLPGISHISRMRELYIRERGERKRIIEATIELEEDTGLSGYFVPVHEILHHQGGGIEYYRKLCLDSFQDSYPTLSEALIRRDVLGRRVSLPSDLRGILDEVGLDFPPNLIYSPVEFVTHITLTDIWKVMAKYFEQHGKNIEEEISSAEGFYPTRPIVALLMEEGLADFLPLSLKVKPEWFNETKYSDYKYSVSRLFELARLLKVYQRLLKGFNWFSGKWEVENPREEVYSLGYLLVSIIKEHYNELDGKEFMTIILRKVYGHYLPNVDFQNPTIRHTPTLTTPTRRTESAESERRGEISRRNDLRTNNREIEDLANRITIRRRDENEMTLQRWLALLHRYLENRNSESILSLLQYPRSRGGRIPRLDIESPLSGDGRSTTISIPPQLLERMERLAREGKWEELRKVVGELVIKIITKMTPSEREILLLYSQTM